MKTIILNSAFVLFIIFVAGFFANHLVLANQESGTVFKGEKITIRVDGLSCPFCAYGLEKKLKSLQGVEKIEIKVNDGVVFLYLKKDAEIAESVLRKKVKEAGFTPREINGNKSEVTLDAPAKKVTLKIEGMTCENCVSRVENALNGIGCAKNVEVNLENNQATLTCLGDKSHQKQLVEAVENLGFKAEIVEAKEN